MKSIYNFQFPIFNDKNFKSYLLSIILSLTILFSSCHNHKEGDGHDHGTTETKAEEHHEEAEPTIASLTAEQIKTVGIQLGTVEQKQLTATLKVNGILKVPNNNKAYATSLYGGIIKTINVQTGSYVKKGQIIATITNVDVLRMQEEYLILNSSGGNSNSISTAGNSQYATLKLEKESLLPQIDYEKKELARQNELYEGNAGARKNLELAQSNLIALQKKLEVLNSQIQIFSTTANTSNASRINSLKIQLQNMGIAIGKISPNNLQSNFYVKSPISGAVSNVFSKIGTYVDVSYPVVEIVDNSSLHLDLNVFEKDLPMLKVGQVIHFTLTNNPTQEYDAKIYSIGTSFENESKTIPIHCTVQGNKTGLIDGMNITAIVSLNDITAPAVPNGAIVEAEGKYFIFVVTDKMPEEHHEEEGTDEHGHEHGSTAEADEHKHEEGEKHNVEKETMTNFEKIEVVKGVSNLGYTAITFVTDIPQGAKIVTKGAFFVNAKLTNQGEGHSH
ncbi:MAG: efflux RND transporter periplasmic adaptor subunit [Bacteroidetes bacterium]|nr:efflux RND transporter periplasmic adaptor subunit [Bacteroidota bacterium]